jgi:hypothetical protein
MITQAILSSDIQMIMVSKVYDNSSDIKFRYTNDNGE